MADYSSNEEETPKEEKKISKLEDMQSPFDYKRFFHALAKKESEAPKGSSTSDKNTTENQLNAEAQSEVKPQWQKDYWKSKNESQTETNNTWKKDSWKKKTEEQQNAEAQQEVKSPYEKYSYNKETKPQNDKYTLNKEVKPQNEKYTYNQKVKAENTESEKSLLESSVFN
ncbi:hypothetical protein PFFVO_02671 [Plasmodium falciparum Vietnam Oak-Knoll (FVO)]|uniref:Uncharacterized protein n=1 Tax=Plasmodium falciparum Vietnam Oak-Knoll (FVO) TaxID=1036723 RepID=A0A024V7J6_PLAFA|nr:hypothetical protein PFFVO_02671 [Plasmodium falciparum Vietnam Oak-Knoll (FVO)]